MDINNIDLKKLINPLNNALYAYTARTSLTFDNYPDFTLTPEKPNSARTIIQVKYDNQKIGSFYAIIFAKGDGTGDSKTYKLNDLTLSNTNIEPKERIIPRAKTETICEGFFPLFSVTPKQNIRMYAASLDELTIINNEIIPLYKLGQDNLEYSKTINDKKSQNPKIYYTVGNSLDGTRFGDPHSIYYSKNIEDALQVVGFLGITNPNLDIPKITKNWIIPIKIN